MHNYNYTLDEKFLDFVFGHMFKTRGKYLSTRMIHTEIEQSEKQKFRYNDILMALEQLALDGYLILESIKMNNWPVYRLTYKGYFDYKSSKSKRPYRDKIKLSRNNKTKSLWTRIAIIANAVAIIIITGWSVYIDQKNSSSDKRAIEIENRIIQIELEINELKNDTINSTNYLYLN